MTLEIDDRIAITDLINLHGHHADDGDFDAMLSLFTEDVVLRPDRRRHGRRWSATTRSAGAAPKRSATTTRSPTWSPTSCCARSDRTRCTPGPKASPSWVTAARAVPPMTTS